MKYKKLKQKLLKDIEIQKEYKKLKLKKIKAKKRGV